MQSFAVDGNIIFRPDARQQVRGQRIKADVAGRKLIAHKDADDLPDDKFALAGRQRHRVDQPAFQRGRTFRNARTADGFSLGACQAQPLESHLLSRFLRRIYSYVGEKTRHKVDHKHTRCLDVDKRRFFFVLAAAE